MLLNLVEYHWAENLDDALFLLARLDVKTVPLAGGTYLLSLEDESIQAVVDLRDLGLVYLSEDVRGLHIGAMTTLRQMAEAPLLKEYASGIVAKAAYASSSSHLVRNSATLGGTLGAGLAARADLLTALTALDAEAVLRSGSRTQVNLGGGTAERPGLPLAGVVYRGKQERRVPCQEVSEERRPSELIIEVHLPRPVAANGASFMRVARTAGDVALLNVAAFVEIEDGTYRKVRLAFGGINMAPQRLTSLEKALEGQSVAPAAQAVEQQIMAALKAAMNEFRPPADSLVSSGYRRVCGMNMAYRALEEAVNGARWRMVMTSSSDSGQQSALKQQGQAGRNL
jgi:CO/xanthine dehydrogenase FAD-binding subunit